MWEFRKWYGYGWSDWQEVTERVRHYNPVDDDGKIEFRLVEATEQCDLCEAPATDSKLCLYHLTVPED